MPGLTVRGFECSLCQRPFALLVPDFMPPVPLVCDDCLGAVWELDSKALMKYVSEHKGAHGKDSTWLNGIAQRIKWHKEQWKTTADLIRQRNRERGIPA
ncbi:MAG: hypothetical protein GY803_29930 [Chloroflexi bacterium]|nr:hypothetical protein [Chloroflexota bacterium]